MVVARLNHDYLQITFWVPHTQPGIHISIIDYNICFNKFEIELKYKYYILYIIFFNNFSVTHFSLFSTKFFCIKFSFFF